MDSQLFNKLYAEGIISDASLVDIQSNNSPKIISVFWELRILLYLGVLLFTAGSGILIYKNIDTIGHTFIILFITLVSAGCFMYCIKQSASFSLKKVDSPNSYFDYILLLACLTFSSVIAYLQFKYNVFGIKYGLALFIPMAMFFVSAYYFDNLAILSLAITNLGAWAGIIVTPMKILSANNYDSPIILYTGIALGILLTLAGYVSKKIDFKAHFNFTFSNIGAHLLFISCLAAMMFFDYSKYVWTVALIIIGFYFYKKALEEGSFYFLLIMTLYGYIGFSYIVLQAFFLNQSLNEMLIYITFIYFIITSIGLISFLIKMNKKFKTI